MVTQPSPAPVMPASSQLTKVSSKRYFVLAWVFTALSLVTFFIPFIGLAFAIPATIFSFKAKKAHEANGFVLASVLTVTSAGFLAFVGVMVTIIGVIFFVIPQIMWRLT